jgi:hypothetical protein
MDSDETGVSCPGCHEAVEIGTKFDCSVKACAGSHLCRESLMALKNNEIKCCPFVASNPSMYADKRLTQEIPQTYIVAFARLGPFSINNCIQRRKSFASFALIQILLSTLKSSHTRSWVGDPGIKMICRCGSCCIV